ncbi:DUF2007 domain-containing protein [Dasania marina]|uniref:putative signal transducing protein n=1 Tax=Dasania marina TaxID=471499 RepID=UPI0030D91C50|tara:strand:- start:100691 stop:101086 length:396 start_codon:yes stop_codon:yes gene_type:complete
MLITISTYSFPYEAQIARAKLDSEGVPAFVADEQTINMQWLYSNAMGGVRLQVPADFVEIAKEILSEDCSEELTERVDSEFIPCPVCGSNKTEYYQFGRRWAFLAFIVINFPLFPIKSGIKCKECGHVSKT